MASLAIGEWESRTFYLPLRKGLWEIPNGPIHWSLQDPGIKQNSPIWTSLIFILSSIQYLSVSSHQKCRFGFERTQGTYRHRIGLNDLERKGQCWKLMPPWCKTPSQVAQTKFNHILDLFSKSIRQLNHAYPFKENCLAAASAKTSEPSYFFHQGNHALDHVTNLFTMLIDQGDGHGI